MILHWIVVGFSFIGVTLCEEVIFDKDSLTAVDEATLDPSILSGGDYNDTASCGSILFHYATEVNKNLDVNIRVSQFSQQGSSQYFRAHPAFITCLQSIYTSILNDHDLKIEIVQGYEPVFNTSAYTDRRSDYLSSGCGSVLNFESGAGNSELIVRVALMKCPIIFEAYQRDIGIEVLPTGSILVFMTGDLDDAPVFMNVTKSAALSYINQGLDPLKIPDCSSFTQLAQGSSYPAGITDPVTIVGDIDSPITSTNDTDFAKLVQYLGSDIKFTDTEGYGCTDEYLGNNIHKRCPDRLMSARMYRVITHLKSYVNNSTLLGGPLEIDEAWDNGTEHPNHLHTEGRAVRLKYQPANTQTNLERISRLAICAGADFVQHNTDHLFLAVKKQKGREEQSVSFPTMTLLAVEPPTSKSSSYSLPDRMRGVEDLYPLFDSEGMLDQLLADDAPVSTFTANDPQYRYFRVDPAIVQCYSQVAYRERTDENGTTAVEVVHAFMSNDEQATLIQIGQERYNTHTLGQALELKYDNSTYNITRLLLNIIDLCGPVFDSFGYNMKIGLYWESVYFSVSDTFGFWANPTTMIPSGFNETTYGAYLNARKQLAIAGRIVAPDDRSEACTSPDVPQKQSIFYEYTTPLSIQRKQANRTHACNVTRVSTFCTQTLSHRQSIVTSLWNTMSVVKTVLHNPQDEVKTALEGCFLACGTCMEGEIWEDKIKHCSNLIHWAPFDLLNEGVSTNIYARDNVAAKTEACRTGRHCLPRSPMFSQFVPFIKKTYRPDPTKSVVEDLYSAIDNPSPLLMLMEEMYVMHASGTINFWVKDEREMVSLEKSLKTALLYNQEVDYVHIYVMNDISKVPVNNIVEALIKKLATESCPTYTREMVAPYQVLSVPVSP